MRERARNIGGDLSIKAAPGRGTTVTVTLPGLGIRPEAKNADNTRPFARRQGFCWRTTMPVYGRPAKPD